MSLPSSPPSASVSSIDLSVLPPVFVLSTHLTTEDLHQAEDRLHSLGARVTYDVHEARLFLGRVQARRRAEFELRCRKLWTEEFANEPGTAAKDEERKHEPAKKRQKTAKAVSVPETHDIVDITNESTTDSESEEQGNVANGAKTAIQDEPQSSAEPLLWDGPDDMIQVLRLDWLHDSMNAEKGLPLSDYVVYQGRPIDKPKDAVTPQAGKTALLPAQFARPKKKSAILPKGELKEILERAKADAAESDRGTVHGRTFSRHTHAHSSQSSNHRPTRPIHFLKETTSEHDEGVSSALPPVPAWIREGKKYACERETPLHPPNEAFIDQLKTIRLARILTLDEIGVRAYSTSIASLAAYPHTLTSTREILNLPGCDTKIARLFHEWKNNDGQIQTVAEIDADPTLKVLRVFYEIWGVGATTARDFYGKGWRDLDDIVEYGWNTLSRVQQIGLKYYDEFQEGIQRREVERIATTIVDHARKVRGDDDGNGIVACVVGGYRRGKPRSGDVDMILSHRSQDQTKNLVRDIVISLEESGWITHTLSLTLTNTKRNQQPLSLHPRERGTSGHRPTTGFDTLDKALVVWQDPHFAASSPSSAKPPKNPNTHQRVDIIIAPFSTLGCAVAGWSGGTTFQRDLRRFATKERGWKFDSSGVRDRATGAWVDLEGAEAAAVKDLSRVSGGMGEGKGKGKAVDSGEVHGFEDDGEPSRAMMQGEDICIEKEKLVFQGLGLEWIEPEMRNTG
ncbi:MAG: hypothetical protein M1817_001255 [Caeruleum heppii]|nr:MAG: hypothetical protein M1817_001255 [Caeruleum heppii]